MESGVSYKNSPYNNNLVREDKRVREMFELAGRDFRSWESLYKIFEIIQPGFMPRLQKKNNDKFLYRMYMFQRTANHYRHADDINYPLRIPPMALPEAKSLMKLAIFKWLTKKQQELLDKKQ
jgi:hypothetical protein